MKKGSKRLTAVISMFLLMAGIIIISSGPAAADAPAKILIGTTVSESGYMAEDSIPSFKGRKLAVDLINKQGGVLLSKYQQTCARGTGFL